MLIGYARVSKADGSQSLDLQRDALGTAGVDAVNVYDDLASGVRDDRPGLDSCLRALRKDDVLVVWKLDRLGRNLAHLVNTVQDLAARGVGLRVLAGQGAQVDTTTAGGPPVVGRHVVPLPALPVEPQPPPGSPARSSPAAAFPGRADPGEAVEHDREKRPVPQTGQGARVRSSRGASSPPPVTGPASRPS